MTAVTDRVPLDSTSIVYRALLAMILGSMTGADQWHETRFTDAPCCGVKPSEYLDARFPQTWRESEQRLINGLLRHRGDESDLNLADIAEQAEAMLWALGQQYGFGDAQCALWLSTANPVYDGKSPIEAIIAGVETEELVAWAITFVMSLNQAEELIRLRNVEWTTQTFVKWRSLRLHTLANRTPFEAIAAGDVALVLGIFGVNEAELAAL